MARDVTVHFVGNARDLAASSAVAEASVDRFGNATARAGAKAEVASAGEIGFLGPLIAIGVAAAVATAPITVLATTFAGLAAGVVGLAAITGNLGDISGQAAASTEDLAAQQQKVTDAATTAALAQKKYNDTVKQYGASSDQAKAALVSLHSAQQAANDQQEKLNALQAQGQGPIAGLIAHIKDMGNALGQQAAPMARMFIEILDGLIPKVQELGSRLLDWFGSRLPAMLPIFTQIVQGLVGAVLWLGQAWGNLVDWFMAHWAGYTASLKSVFDQIGTGIHFALPLLGLIHEMFVRLGPVIGFVRDHADSLKPVLYAVGALLIAMAASAALTGAAILLLVAAITAIASAISFAVNWIKNAVEWLGYLIDKAGGVVGAIQAIGRAISSLPSPAGAVAQFLGGGRQSGGPVLPGGIYTVGEAGPETLVMAGSGGYVIPGGRAAAGGSTYNISVSVSPLASPADTGRAVVAAIQEYERRGSKAWRGA